MAKNFVKLSSTVSPIPEVVLCSLPTIELAQAATEFGKKFGVPVVLDVRDLWPDVIVDYVPAWARPLARLLTLPMRRAVRRICADATTITGVSTPVVGWGIKHAGREITALDIPFPFGYQVTHPNEHEILSAKDRWKSLGLQENPEEFVCSFFGTLGRNFDLATVIEAAKILEQSGRKFRFVFCGSGEKEKHFQALATGVSSVCFPGWVNKNEILTLMDISAVGLAPYDFRHDFNIILPNKPIEYLSAGLPVVTSLEGVLGGLLEEYQCGEHYEHGNPGSLASLLAALQDDPERCKKMASNALALFEKRFRAETVYGEMIAYLEDISQSGHRKAE
jgi:glycosyltransferase involved in cell wall biosynthesis